MEHHNVYSLAAPRQDKTRPTERKKIKVCKDFFDNELK